MNPNHKEQLIRNAVFRKTRGEQNWFKYVKEKLLLAYDNPNVDFEKTVQDWLSNCKKFNASSVESAINDLILEIKSIENDI